MKKERVWRALKIGIPVLLVVGLLVYAFFNLPPIQRQLSIRNTEKQMQNLDSFLDLQFYVSDEKGKQAGTAFGPLFLLKSSLPEIVQTDKSSILGSPLPPLPKGWQDSVKNRYTIEMSKNGEAKKWMIKFTLCSLRENAVVETEYKKAIFEIHGEKFMLTVDGIAYETDGSFFRKACDLVFAETDDHDFWPDFPWTE